jgi:hypothetical protein
MLKIADSALFYPECGLHFYGDSIPEMGFDDKDSRPETLSNAEKKAARLFRIAPPD